MLLFPIPGRYAPVKVNPLPQRGKGRGLGKELEKMTQ